MITRRSIVTHVLTAGAAIAAVVTLGAGRGTGHAGQPDLSDPKAMQAAIEAYVKTTQPGERHKHLEQFVGQWDTKTRLFWDPTADPAATPGTASFKLIHGGRFLQQETTGQMLMPSSDGAMKPIPLNGLGLTGYDNNRKLYTMVWTDSMSTGVYTGTGNLSQDGKTMTVFGTMDEPMTGEMGKMVRYVTRVVSPDQFVFEIHEVLYGDPFKVVEVQYTRRK